MEVAVRAVPFSVTKRLELNFLPSPAVSPAKNLLIPLLPGTQEIFSGTQETLPDNQEKSLTLKKHFLELRKNSVAPMKCSWAPTKLTGTLAMLPLASLTNLMCSTDLPGNLTTSIKHLNFPTVAALHQGSYDLGMLHVQF